MKIQKLIVFVWVCTREIINTVEYELYQGDCLQVMRKLMDAGIKVDAIITDSPYGTTACAWDTIIPFDEMWKMIKAVIRDNTPHTIVRQRTIQQLSSYLEYRGVQV